jgi:LmbE family N-acetylglucosaminyl deacetylase
MMISGPAGRPRTLLSVWAHPDDEAFLAGGLLASAVDAGWRVVVATATRGENGTDDPEALPPDRLSEVRGRELADSLAALGVTEHRWLRADRPLRDGGLTLIPEEVGVRAVCRVIAAVEPDLIVTFGADGLTGHPDHRTVSRWVTRAWERLGRAGELWHVALTVEFLDRWGELCAEQQVWMDGGPPAPTPVQDLAHVHTCSGPLLDRKYAALAAHASQTAGLIERVGERRFRDWWSTEAFLAADVAGAAEEAA